MACAGAVSSAACGLALLVGVALVGCTPQSCEPDAPEPPSVCKLLAKRNSDRLERLGERCISTNGHAANITLYWGSDPARAASELLRVQLRDVLLYRRVRTAKAPHSTVEFGKNMPFNATARYTDLALSVSTAWKPEKPHEWKPIKGRAAGLAGPRLFEFGASVVPARYRLHAWLVPAARALGACRNHSRSTFYANATALALCDFIDNALQQGNVTVAEVLVVGDCGASLQRLQERAAAAALLLSTRLVNRTLLLRTMRTANYSFLFLDYDIWKGEPNVSLVEPPPCITVDSTCEQELDSSIAIRVGDVGLLQRFAYQLFYYVYDFKPTLETLRLILEREANGVNIEQAVCELALNDSSIFRPKNISVYDTFKYTIAIYDCKEDYVIYDEIASVIYNHLEKQLFEAGYNLSLRRFFINCSDAYHMSKRLDDLGSRVGWYETIGVVSRTVVGAPVAAATASALHVPLLLTNVVPEDDAAASSDVTWRVAGRPRHVALALQYFVLHSSWTRVAVLSQPTTLATHYYAAIQDGAKFALRDFTIPLNIKKQQANDALQKLLATNARIIFVNADTVAAVVILTAALEHQMSYRDGFVWIVRDWQPNNATSKTTHFTVSLWSRDVENDLSTEGDLTLRSALSNHKSNLGRAWPPQAFSLANAILTLVHGYKTVFQRYPDTRQDLHTAKLIRLLNESLIEAPATGVNQLLQYKERSIEETFVYVDKWKGNNFTRLTTLRVNVTSGVVQGNYTRPDALPLDDGASTCTVRSGDAFYPDCYDPACATILLLLALVPTVLVMVRRRLVRLRQEQEIQVIARRRNVATILADYLVERQSLELRQELGAGRFGSVRLALLHAPPRAPRYIAAKALRDNAAATGESEFLREACTIASLNHPHVVRLVGVCITDGPLLVLMEVAFFGDLLGYLRARRHLVENADSESLDQSAEAAHVSAEALTRLAREAAEALQYLASRGVVHCDVRAANCLVDARRSLKLADFGMARDTVASVDRVPQYACRRRGLFPVLWMAPESLLCGLFSAASDVWALGVLLFELVTLGSRPYGEMSPLRVLQHVAAGGRPLLPLDATPHTRGLTRLCWARSAEQRPSAAEVATYLAERPTALHPALLVKRNEPTDADSNFRQSIELLQSESRLLSLDQLEVFATTQ